MSRLLAILLLVGAVVHAQPAIRIPPPDVFSCEDLDIGQHPVAPNACESYFYQCVDGLDTGIRLNCSEGTWFDATSKQCLFARDIEACGGVATTTERTTTTIHPDFTRAPFTIVCADLVDGDYPNPNQPCSAIYATCAAGSVYYRRCPGDTRYDIISKECLEPAFVKTCLGDITTRAPTTTTQQQLDEGIKFDCSGLPDGLYPSTVDVCSTNFWSCTAGDSKLLVCPAGLKFDIESQSCLEHDYIVACKGTATTTVVTTTHTESIEEGLELACGSLSPGMYADPRMQYKTEYGSCSRVFIVCTGIPRAVIHRCPADLVYDASILRCNYRDETYACTGISTMAPPTTTPMMDSIDVMPAPEDFCKDKKIGNYDMEEKKCSHMYITCTASGSGWITKCPSNTYYDMEFDRCDYKDYIPICSGKERPTTTVAPVFPQDPTPGLSEFCATKKDGNYPLHSVCTSSFVTCSNSRATVTHCPGNTKYSTEEDACLSAHDIPSCSQYDSGENVCLGRVAGFYPLPGNCNQFVFCAYRMPVVMSCPDEMVFNPLRARCMPASEVSGLCGTATPLAPFSCEGKTPGYYVRPEDCTTYYFCEKDLSAWAFSCEPGFAFNVTATECFPEAEVKTCLPPRDDTLKPFCETRGRDGIFAHPLQCDKGIICLQTYAFPIMCSEETRQFDRYTLKCTATLSYEAQCKPADSVVTAGP